MEPNFDKLQMLIIENLKKDNKIDENFNLSKYREEIQDNDTSW